MSKRNKAGEIDKIGEWSVRKLEIIRKYAKTYIQILRDRGFTLWYIDGFAGAGVHQVKGTDELVLGSPQQAASIRPPFDHYHLVELESWKVDLLRTTFNVMYGEESRFTVHPGDCNMVVPQILGRMTHRHRAFCLLDPYRMDLDWKVVRAAASSPGADVLINLPAMHMNRNVLRRDIDKADPAEAARMTRFWGDDSWRDTLYAEEQFLMGPVPQKKPDGNRHLSQAFCDRLRDVAGFAHVAEPLAMRNSTNAIVYYLVFASQVDVAVSVMGDIFEKHDGHGLFDRMD